MEKNQRKFGSYLKRKRVGGNKFTKKRSIS